MFDQWPTGRDAMGLRPASRGSAPWQAGPLPLKGRTAPAEAVLLSITAHTLTQEQTPSRWGLEGLHHRAGACPLPPAPGAPRPSSRQSFTALWARKHPAIAPHERSRRPPPSRPLPAGPSPALPAHNHGCRSQEHRHRQVVSTGPRVASRITPPLPCRAWPAPGCTNGSRAAAGARGGPKSSGRPPPLPPLDARWSNRLLALGARGQTPAARLPPS